MARENGLPDFVVIIAEPVGYQQGCLRVRLTVADGDLIYI